MKAAMGRLEFAIPAFATSFLILILAVVQFSPLEGERREIVSYLTIGIFAFSLMALTIFFKPKTQWVFRIQAALAILFVPLLVYFRHEQFSPWMIWLSFALQFSIHYKKGLAFRKYFTASFLFGWLLTFLACLAVKPYVWHPHPEVWGGNYLYGSMGLLTATVLVALSQVSPKFVSSRIGLIGETLLVVVIFAAASFRQKFIINDYALFGGAIGLVQQGGIMLWDVPSQYGFLNIFLASLIPGVSPNQAAYLANSFYIFLTSLTTWMIFRSVFQTWGGRFLAFLISFCCLFLLAGWIPEFWGPNSSPSTGGFRFLPVHLMLAWLFWNSRDKKRFQSNRFLGVGTALYAVGSMWSVENLYFLTVIWLSVFGFSILTSKRNPLLVFAPFVGLIAAWLALAGFYFLRYGHGIDFLAFIEFTTNHTTGYGSLPINLDGAVSVLLWIGAGLLFVAYHCISTNDPRAFLSIGAFAAVWATSVYFVGRSHDNNVGNISAILLTSVAAILALCRENSNLAKVELVFKSAMLPLFVVVLATCFSNREALQPWWHSLEKTIARPLGEYESESPSMTAEEMELLMTSGYNPSQPLVNHSALPALLPIAPHGHLFMPRMWLPLNPGCHVSLLAPERRAVYVQRWLDREQLESGWILEPLSLSMTEGLEDIGSCPMQNLKFEIYPVVEKYYRKVFQRDLHQYRLMRFERIKPAN